MAEVERHYLFLLSSLLFTSICTSPQLGQAREEWHFRSLQTRHRHRQVGKWFRKQEQQDSLLKILQIPNKDGICWTSRLWQTCLKLVLTLRSKSFRLQVGRKPNFTGSWIVALLNNVSELHPYINLLQIQTLLYSSLSALQPCDQRCHLRCKCRTICFCKDFGAHQIYVCVFGHDIMRKGGRGATKQPQYGLEIDRECGPTRLHEKEPDWRSGEETAAKRKGSGLKASGRCFDSVIHPAADLNMGGVTRESISRTDRL